MPTTDVQERWAKPDRQCPICSKPMHRYTINTPPYPSYSPTDKHSYATRAYWKCPNNHRMMIEEPHA